MSTSVWLVESDPASVALIRRGFSNRGVHVLALSAVREVERKLESCASRPQAVVLSEHPRDATGLDALRAVRSMAPTLPVVFVPTFAPARTRRRAYRLGAAAVVDRPFDMEDLVKATLQSVADEKAEAS